MADYEARREDDGPTEHDRQNAKNTTRVAAKAAGAYLGGEAGAKAVDLVSKTKLGDKALDIASAPIKYNKIARNVNNKLNDSGAMKVAEGALDASSGSMGGGSGTPGGTTGGTSGTGAGTGAGLPNQTPNQVKNKNNVGGEQESSLPSSDSNKNLPNNNASSGAPDNKRGSGGGLPKDNSLDEGSNQEDKSDGNGSFKGFISAPLKAALFLGTPFVFFLLIIVCVFAVIGVFGDYEDAIGISSTTGEDTGGVTFYASSPEQQDFYDRIVSVKNSYQSNGKTVDALKIVAVYNILNKNGAGLTYKDMTDSAIREIADAMFNGNSYDETTFKNNLINNIIPKYIPKATKAQRESIADDVFKFIEDYYSLIGKNNNSCSSSSSGSCTYDIKGFYIQGKGNVAKNIKVTDLYVRLMQCGTANGHNYGGTFGKPMDGEDLVPFEKYVLGAAYQEIGPTAPEAAIKAQLVATRSYALARPTEMGGWRTLAEENGKWILQAAACTQDQVYCDPDQGCSSNDGQWGQIHSGLNHNSGFSRSPMPEDSPMRTYASEVEGEVLTNSIEYIIYAGFTSTDQNQWSSLANSGLNYKQILLQHYNQGSRNYGATDIKKASCGNGSGGVCTPVATGDWANWKQYEGSWIGIQMGTSGKTIRQIGCLVTSISIQIARSGVKTNISGEFNPGSFVEYLNNHGGFASGGNFVWAAAEQAAPDFKYNGEEYVSGWTRQAKLDKIKSLTSQKGVYVVAEVKGNTGQHWVAIDTVQGDTVKMFDPGSESTDMWSQYNWANTSRLVWWKVG